MQQQQQQQLIIIKFGGAYISKKEEFETIWRENIDNLVYIVNYLSNIKNHKLIIILGAGSFGHQQAYQYKVKQGNSSPDFNIDYLSEGLLKTRESVTKLLNIVKSELVKNGLNVHSISPFNSWRTNNGGDNVVFDNIDNIKFSLNNFPKVIPIIHGDCCFDDTLGCTIISGDTIIKQLSFKLNPDKCIYISDVNGVYNLNPKENENAELISHINITHNNNIKLGFNNNDNNSKDVTGGMIAKLDSAIKVAKNKIHTLIIGGNYSKEEILETILIDIPTEIKKGTFISCN